MIKRCTRQFVKKTHRKEGSWRKAAKELNIQFEVNISHTTWRDYATGRHDIANLHVRKCLGLPPRPCPTCGKLPKSKNRKTSEKIHIPSYGYPRESPLSFEKMFERLDPSK